MPLTHPTLQANSYRLGRLLALAFAQQAAEVGRRLDSSILEGEGDLPGLEHWVEQLAGILKPTVTQLFHQGIVESRRRLAGLQGSGGMSSSAPIQGIVVRPRHTFGESRVDWRKQRKQLGTSFDLFDPRVLRAVDRATLSFCEETNDTATTDLKEAIRKLRQLLRAGLEKGKAIAQLAREVKRIFADPARAYRIAVSETSRAVHAGALYNAKESSLKLKKEWLASLASCPLCLDLNGVQKELDEPFLVDGTGPYARIMHPPRHPHCACSWTEVIL